MLRKIMHAVLALTVVVGVAASATQEAEARRGNLAAGIAVGTIVGLGIAGAYGGPRYYGTGPRYYEPACFRGPRQCGWVGRKCWTNRFDETVCRGGDYRCWRPTICD